MPGKGFSELSYEKESRPNWKPDFPLDNITIQRKAGTVAEQQDSTNAKRIVLGVLSQVSEVHLNVSQNVIVTTEDKLRLHLSDTAKVMGRKNAWIAPLGIVISIVLTLVTADFKDYGLKAPTWEAIFIIGAVLASVWLVYALWQRSKLETVDDLIEKIKE
jgi:hypothetical protein